MMQAIRSKSQGVIAWIIVGIIALVFTLWGMEGFLGNNPEKVVANIDGEKITQRELEASYERLSRMKPPTNALESEQLRQVALERLVNMAILSQTIDNLGMYVGSERVRQTIMTSPDFLVDGVFSQERYHQALRGALLTDRDLQSELRHVLSVEQLQNGIVGTAFTLPRDVDEIVKFIDQKRRVGYALISHEKFKSQVVVKDPEVEQYYEDHQAQFVLPEQVKVDYIELSLSSIAANLDFSDSELKEYYDDHPAMFTSDERIRASHILIPDDEKASSLTSVIMEKLAAGESFEDLAQQYSQDPISARNGGDLEWFGHGQMIPEFEQAAFELKVGQVSKPIKTEYGWHIIKLTDYQPPEKPAFSKVKSQVEAQMRHNLAEEKLYDAIESVSVMAFEQPNSLRPIAEAVKLPIQTSDYFSIQGGLGIFSHPAVLEAAFSEDVKESGNNSDVLQINREAFVVLRVNDQRASRQQPLAEVQEDIREGLIAKHAIELTEGLSEDIVMSIKQGKNPRDVAKFHRVEWEQEPELMRIGSALDPLLVEYAFSIPRPASGELNGMAAPLPNGDYVSIVVFDVTQGDPQGMSSDRKEAYMTGLAQAFGELDYQLLLAHAIREKKVDIR